MITIEVPGLPAPGGSKRGFAWRDKDNPGKLRVSVKDSGNNNKEWRAVAALAAQAAMNGRPPLSGPLHVLMVFRIPRPKGHFRTGKHAGQLRDSAPLAPITRPDVLKLARSTEDALTGIVWGDDSQTASLVLKKVYADDCPPGCRVVVERLQ